MRLPARILALLDPRIDVHDRTSSWSRGKLTANARGADKSRMANRGQTSTPADGPSGEERSMTKRMLDLIHHFGADERRRRTETEAADPVHQRRRDDKPAPSSTRADDLIVEPTQPEGPSSRVDRPLRG